MRAMRPGQSHHVDRGQWRFTENAGTAAAKQLLAGAEQLPTAVVCANDRIAIGVLDGLRRAALTSRVAYP